MNRRTSLKTLMAASAGLVALPAWAKGWLPGEFGAERSSFSPAEQDVLSSVADTIIPAGDSLGALTVGVDKFLQKLIDDCYEKDVQENVKVQLAGLATAAKSNYGKSFMLCDQQQRQELLLKLSVSDDKNERDFFDLIKSETIRGFRTSKEVMLSYLNYQMVPGHYYGCVDVKA
ncbi:MAG: gluconate 2-dehydrogenase subunit 3 family protein [Cyclobacteriaceae bacterium]|nr:gluconate 2-dehydrogenase subunit 3 family protein [Cyclobacteriaceae bacterium]MDH4296385.1 gluconate 2-dehydrogenase subunit 3 family protein [Cyclobacteriaceae bacterium]MDH5250974.1 gluconate 2-dehydrogenase subunit 3 family protein [Cyclobacteriaceae bacterium]